jgi:hypothetical protein
MNVFKKELPYKLTTFEPIKSTISWELSGYLVEYP